MTAYFSWHVAPCGLERGGLEVHDPWMRFARAAVMTMILLAGMVPSPARPAASASASDLVLVDNRAYVPAPSWARAAGLQPQWLKREESLQLTGASATVVLRADAREAIVNGVQVWLSFPVLLRNGTLCISRLDTRFTLDPLVARRGARASSKAWTVCLDPGHGGKDAGFQAGSRQEKAYTLLLAQEVRAALATRGIRTSLTRTKDVFLDLPVRAALARSRKANLFVSLHFNSAEGSVASAKGAEVYCLTPAGAASTNARGEAANLEWLSANRNNDDSLRLAYTVQKTLLGKVGMEDRGVRRARFAVLREATMPAILIEAGFMSHPLESRKIVEKEYRRQLAAAIAQGIVEYRRLAERES